MKLTWGRTLTRGNLYHLSFITFTPSKKQNKNLKTQKLHKNQQNLENKTKICKTQNKIKSCKTQRTPKIFTCFPICVVSMYNFFLVEMMNSCSVNSFHMPSYNLMLYLVLSLVANVQTLSLKLVGSKKQNRVQVVLGYDMVKQSCYNPLLRDA